MIKFDPEWYVSQYPDVFASGMDPLEHYVRYGRYEGRQANPNSSAVASGDLSRIADKSLFGQRRDGSFFFIGDKFDYLQYRVDNEDIAEAIPADTTLLERHWHDHGVVEGRQAYRIQPYAHRQLDRQIWGRHPTITMYGFFNATTGLGAAARLYSAAFKHAGFKVYTVNVEEQNGRLLTAELEDNNEDATKSRINFYILNADMMNIFFLPSRMHLLNNSYNIAVWYWELSYFKSEWITAFGPVDEVWVASEFCAQSVRSLSPIPVKVLPPPVMEVRDCHENKRSYFGIKTDAFVFGVIFDVGSAMERKNPQAALTAFTGRFSGVPNSVLLLKFHGAYRNKHAIKDLYRAAEGHDNVRFLGSVLTDEEMSYLRSTIDCLVSPHRAEGFGFNAAEMLLLDKPVIATNYSGTSDFITSETGYPISYTLRKTGTNAAPYPSDALWADPDVECLSRTMVNVFEDQAAAKFRARRGHDLIVARYSLAACAANIRSRIDEIGILSEIVPLPTTWGSSNQVRTPSRPMAGKRISYITIVDDASADKLIACVNSILAQSYTNIEHVIYNNKSMDSNINDLLEFMRGKHARVKIVLSPFRREVFAAINHALEFTSGDYIFVVGPSSAITTDASLLIQGAAAKSDADIIYGDDIHIDAENMISSVHYKPDWSPDRYESDMYVGNGVAVKRDFLLTLGGFNGTGVAMHFDLLLRSHSLRASIHHVSALIYCSTDNQSDVLSPQDLETMHRTIEFYLERTNRRAEVIAGLLPGTFRIRDNIPEGTTVTLLIFTDNRNADISGKGSVNLAYNLIESILHKTKSSCIWTILLVDNSNADPKTREMVERSGGRVISYLGEDNEKFNFAKKANFGFRAVQTEYVVMMNDDMEVIAPDWLDALIEVAIRPGVGTVGAKLLFEDDTIQHSGVVLGVFNDVAHIYHGYPESEPGYYGCNKSFRNYSALTGACLALKTKIFYDVNGFDETLAIDYNDIDFCLRLGQLGYRNVYTPYAKLYHFEGKTAVRKSVTKQDQIFFHKHWRSVIECDPFYNRNLTRDDIDFSYAALL